MVDTKTIEETDVSSDADRDEGGVGTITGGSDRIDEMLTIMRTLTMTVGSLDGEDAGDVDEARGHLGQARGASSGLSGCRPRRERPEGVRDSQPPSRRRPTTGIFQPELQ
ncbi:hypothetical protein GP486_003951, partial [Trichoglossum hirsutum]